MRSLVRSLRGSGEERELKDWRERNAARRFDAPPLDDPKQQRFVDELRANGIATGTWDELFGGEQQLYDELAAAARGVYERFGGPAGIKDNGDGKDYIASMLPRTLDADDPFARVALHPKVLAVANRYLELKSLLRSLELWLTIPTPGDATETQLWHRDGDDLVNVKFYVFFTDVTEEAGPFTYAERTHPYGPNRTMPERDEKGRATDEQMRAVAPETDWRYGTGPRATVMFADTSGYHKQSKPRSQERLMMMAQYTSGTPNYPVAVELTGLDLDALSDEQRAAITP
ncbi:MAG: hypothetical protein QOE69_486 [Thermoleophilaceae bacterium]|jgi:hypothetical protein|nr:hypothetical protein [Thermoleophilaceae bacterium]